MARTHEYGTEGSDHPPRDMLAKCTCGWSGPVIKGQGLASVEQAVQQWGEHMGWKIERDPTPKRDGLNVNYDWKYSKDNFWGTAPNHWAACRAVEEKCNEL